MSRNISIAFRVASSLTLLVLVALTPESLHAQAPDRVSYQGYLTAESGRALEGDFEITFKIFDGADPMSASLIWEQPPLVVTVRDGIFNEHLPTDFNGDGVIADVMGEPEVPFTRFTFDGSSRYLELTIDGEQLRPRQLITSVPFAMTSSGVSARTDILVMANMTTGQLIPAGGCTDVNFVDSVDTTDTTVNPGGSVVLSPFVFTVPIAGFYRVSAMVALHSPVDMWGSSDHAFLAIRRSTDNSTLKYLGADANWTSAGSPRAAAQGLILNGSTLLELAQGDGIKLSVCSQLRSDATLGLFPAGQEGAQNWVTIEYVRSR